MIKAIVAVDSEGGIGKNGVLPWRGMEEDLKYFKKQTLGGLVLMGRVTWEGLPLGYLPNRINYVLSTKFIKDFETHYIKGFSSIDSLMDALPEHKDAWVIGGATIYEQFMPLVDEIHITRIPGTYRCDTFFNPDLTEFELKNIHKLDILTDVEIFSRKWETCLQRLH